MMHTKSTFDSAAYGGPGWQPRTQAHDAELGGLWADCGISNEWQTLRSVIMHTPGQELQQALDDPNSAQMLAPLDIAQAITEHQQIIETYEQHGVVVHQVAPQHMPSPNQMFCADLMAMTPEGAILARPASLVRAGEERHMARCLADLGIPILRTLNGNATFEGADLIWLNRQSALLGRGLRSNAQAAAQILPLLDAMGCAVQVVDMPYGTMHLMGMLRIVDKNLALAWPRRTPHGAVMALREAGYEVSFVPETAEFIHRKAFNFVTLGPRKILMVGNNPEARSYYESLGIECIESPAQELAKAAGAIGCLTAVIKRA